MSVNFYATTISKWDQFASITLSQKGQWIYRGQRKDKNWPLRTTLERALNNWSIDVANGPAIERQLVRDFRRRYRGGDQDRVDRDTLYCLALMQHHGAPTRLLDWTYSPFVAAKNAIESGAKDGVVYCLNAQWCNQVVSKIVGDGAIRARNSDGLRNDSTFISIYMTDPNRRRFVFNENPFHLNERLTIQQGVFMCPGDIASSFVDNITAMDGWEREENLLKICFQLDDEGIRDFAKVLVRMNIDSAALFPGLDGFSRSLGERLFCTRILHYGGSEAQARKGPKFQISWLYVPLARPASMREFTPHPPASRAA